MTIFLEILLDFLLEFILEFAFTFGSERASIKGKSKLKREFPLVYALLGYGALGLVIGIFSLMVFDMRVIKDPLWRLVALFVVPALVAVIMTTIGKVRVKKNKDIVLLDKFIASYFFAFTIGLVRYFGESNVLWPSH